VTGSHRDRISRGRITLWQDHTWEDHIVSRICVAILAPGGHLYD